MGQALEGIRVIDFTQDQSGPVCTEMLAWLGADVIKIERPGQGDRGRRLWWSDGSDADSFFFQLLNSNKRSITLNLRHQEGREITWRLIRGADVVTENLGPGSMDRLGFGYEAVKEANAACIYASVKGFGSWGPHSSYNCFEPVAQATSGAMSMTGYPDGPPTFTQVNVADSGAGVHLATAVLAALVQRHRTRRGQYVEVSMQEVVLNLTRAKFSLTVGTGEPLLRTGNRPPSGAYADLLRCAGGGPNDFVYVVLTPGADEPFVALLDAIGREDLRADERFSTSEARARHRGALSEIVEVWTRQHHKLEVMRILAERGVACGAVLDSAEVLADPHLRARRVVTDLEHPARGLFSMIGSPLHLSDSAVDLRRAPLLGEHTEEVLTTLAGYASVDMDRLRREQVI